MDKIKTDTSKDVLRSGDIAIKKNQQLRRLDQELLPRLQQNKKRYDQNRTNLVELIGKHPKESIATIRGWLYRDL